LKALIELFVSRSLSKLNDLNFLDIESTEYVAVLVRAFLDRPRRSFSSSLDDPSETPESFGDAPILRTSNTKLSMLRRGRSKECSSERLCIFTHFLPVLRIPLTCGAALSSEDTEEAQLSIDGKLVTENVPSLEEIRERFPSCGIVYEVVNVVLFLISGIVVDIRDVYGFSPVSALMSFLKSTYFSCLAMSSAISYRYLSILIS